MSITISTLIDLFSQHQFLAYLILFLGSYFETLIGPGFFIPGEPFFLGGAILAGTGVLNMIIVSISCILGGILGDSSSYFIGRRYGEYIFKILFKKENKHFNIKNYNKGINYLKTYGKKSIFFARLMGPLSWITPFLAGTLHIKYKDFIKYNVPGVIVGIGWFLMIGYIFGFSYSIILSKIQKWAFYAILIVAIIILIFILKKFNVFNKVKIKQPYVLVIFLSKRMLNII